MGEAEIDGLSQLISQPRRRSLSVSAVTWPFVDRDGEANSVLPPADSGRRTNELTGPRPERSSRVLESLLDGCRAGRPVSETPRERERQPMMAVDGLRRPPGGRSGLERSRFLQRQTTADLEWDQNPSWSEERRAPASMSIGASTQTDTKTFSCKGAHNLYSPMGNTKHKSPYSFSSHHGTSASLGITKIGSSHTEANTIMNGVSS
jgi:hypothetical protein